MKLNLIGSNIKDLVPKVLKNYRRFKKGDSKRAIQKGRFKKGDSTIEILG
ncbi:MAG: hypothetical protein ACXAEU_11840 [Candidatus Hodarchaeales archaeon]